MTSDLDLLAEFVQHGAQDAFTTLVQRHVNLVYSAALRQVRSPQLAEEIAQSVFSDLARNARSLRPDTQLNAWLYQVTRRTAIDVIRKESRHQRREQIAMELNHMNATADDWLPIEPLLDDAMAALEETDRTAILLRYFDNKNLREIGEVLGISEAAAQKRVRRAVDRLAGYFAKRKVPIGASGLAALISAHAVQAAPAGLAGTISAAVAAGTAVHTSLLIAATKSIAMTTLQKTVLTTALVAMASAGIYEAHQAAQLRAQNQTLRQGPRPAPDEPFLQLQRERDDATNRLAALLAENEQLKANGSELLKLRGEVAQFRIEAQDPTETAAKAWFDRVRKLKQHLEEKPAAKIPELQLLSEEDWLGSVKDHPLNSDNDYRRAASSLRGTAENKFGSLAHSALGKYLAANANQFPTDLAQLQPYFEAPVDDAILQRWEMAPASTVPNVGVGDMIITEKAPVDDLLDTRMAIGARGYGNSDFLTSVLGDTLKPVYKAYTEANGENWSNFELSKLLPYAMTPEQQSAVQKMIEQNGLRK